MNCCRRRPINSLLPSSHKCPLLAQILMTESIAKALKVIRVSYELTQTELAQKLQICKSHLSEIESSAKKPSLALLLRYSEVFDLPLSSILFLAEHIDEGIDKTTEFISPKIIALLKFIQQWRSP
jgi:transcriptional regulator with XRE-family HTH domain